MSTSNGVHSFSASPAALIDPNVLKQQLATGISLFSKPSTITRSASEEPSSATSLRGHSTFDFDLPLCPKDDAYGIFEGKNRNLPHQPVGQIPTSRASARQLLDPKGFNKINSSKSFASRSPHATEGFPLPPQTNGHQTPSPIEPGGIGSFIEQLHGISQREARPLKRQKREEEDSNKIKGAFAISKGGELGEYVKEKRKEGLEESGPPNTVVDLTEGSEFLQTSLNRLTDILQAMITMT